VQRPTTVCIIQMKHGEILLKIQWENLTVPSLATVSTVDPFVHLLLHFVALEGHSDITVSLNISLCNFPGKGQNCSTD
jgi:hypothetical protein